MAQGTLSWLNQDFLEKALRKGENDDSIQVHDIFTKAATDKGDNYTSQMIRATIDLSRKVGCRNVTEKKSLIIKVVPDEKKTRELVEKAGLFGTEMIMLIETLPKMNEIQGNIKPFNAKGYYIQKSDPPLLVFDDLAPMGFRMANRQAGLDIDHSLMALRSLARFHACSIAVCEKEPKTKEIYNKGMFNSAHGPEMSQFFNSSVKALAKEMANWSEFDPEISEKLLKLSEVIYTKGIEACELKKDEFHVINHGDFWVNNMLFRYDNHGKVIDQIFVDFQLCVYGTPAIDLHYFLNTSVSQEVYEDSMELLLTEYVNSLSNWMQLSGCKTEPISLEGLKKVLKEREIFGLIASVTVLPIVLVNKDDAKNFDEMLDENGEIKDGGYYRGEIYRQVVGKRLPKWHKKGLLDL
ncbi:uncharacterized protein LOC122501882 [Leptopilina heterotoma]|uniref:uncharacterized protein LOC122501882 n=1 Tax=Leptopilina heterotoma TaxID=63436 RepID=UPI001CA7DB4B|nr:uncharacterized protein LOC122501882 [Leptopilina heterotoma]